MLIIFQPDTREPKFRYVDELAVPTSSTRDRPTDKVSCTPGKRAKQLLLSKDDAAWSRLDGNTYAPSSNVEPQRRVVAAAQQLTPPESRFLV
jgi:hypothetical protein